MDLSLLSRRQRVGRADFESEAFRWCRPDHKRSGRQQAELQQLQQRQWSGQQCERWTSAKRLSKEEDQEETVHTALPAVQEHHHSRCTPAETESECRHQPAEASADSTETGCRCSPADADR